MVWPCDRFQLNTEVCAMETHGLARNRFYLNTELCAMETNNLARAFTIKNRALCNKNKWPGIANVYS